MDLIRYLDIGVRGRARRGFNLAKGLGWEENDKVRAITSLQISSSDCCRSGGVFLFSLLLTHRLTNEAYQTATSCTDSIWSRLTVQTSMQRIHGTHMKPNIRVLISIIMQWRREPAPKHLPPRFEPSSWSSRPSWPNTPSSPWPLPSHR